MLLKRNIWLVFYTLVVVGVLYLAFTITSAWWGIQDRTRGELATVNRIYSASVQTSFDQLEIMLDLLGNDLLNDKLYEDSERATALLDTLMARNKALVGFGLSDLDGNLIAASSSIDLERMPNLKTHVDSRETFARALQRHDMVIGDTYYLAAIDNWVIPFRKSIRDHNNKLIGVMTTGIKPGSLVPQLAQQFSANLPGHIPLMLIHDGSFRYAYISVFDDSNMLQGIINEPIPQEILEGHRVALEAATGLAMQDMRDTLNSAEYTATSQRGGVHSYSLLYIPKYRLWSIAFLPQNVLLDQLLSQSVHYVLSFMGGLLVLFLLVRHIHQFEQRRHQQLLDLANHDFLTGLNNRLYLQSAEQNWIHETSGRFSILFVDLDNFKNINDSYGHSFGDKILQQVAKRLLRVNLGKSLVCRQGGDEFIILSRRTGDHQLRQMAADIMGQISMPFQVEQFDFTIGASIGICLYPDDGDSFDSLFSAADTAMYQAKQRKLHYFIFTEELRQQTRDRHRIEQALHHAVKNRELYMLYQPQLLCNGQLYGVEALVRWDNELLGPISPAEFIPIAEDSSTIIDLGRFIIDRSLRDIAACTALYPQLGIRLSINISVRQFLEKGFITLLMQALDRHRFSASQLTLEITESIFIDDFDYILPIFDQIRALGIKISLDDFGTGYSSLSMLRRLPIDELKIDKSFISQITNDMQGHAMVLNILDIARNMGLKVVAEGIEEHAQFKVLNEHQCDALQGFLYSKPLRFEALSNFCSRLPIEIG